MILYLIFSYCKNLHPIVLAHMYVYTWYILGQCSVTEPPENIQQFLFSLQSQGKHGWSFGPIWNINTLQNIHRGEMFFFINSLDRNLSSFPFPSLHSYLDISLCVLFSCRWYVIHNNFITKEGHQNITFCCI